MASPAEPTTQRSNHPAETMTHADRFILQSKAEVMNSPIRHIDSIVNWMAGDGSLSYGGATVPAICSKVVAPFFTAKPLSASLKGVLLRCVAESNHCDRFCRPAPNHSANAPLVWDCKDSYFLWICNTCLKLLCLLLPLFAVDCAWRPIAQESQNLVSAIVVAFFKET